MHLDRRGVALGLVLWALVVGSAVVAIGLFIGFEEHRAAGTSRRLPRALARAETGLSDALLGRTPGLLGRRILHPFDSVSFTSGLGQPWRGTIQRLNRGLFLVSVTAFDPDSAVATIATQSRLGWLVRVRPVAVPLVAALQAGGVSLGEGSQVVGRDIPPAGADCPEPDSGLTDVRVEADTGFPEAIVPAYEQLSGQATMRLSGGTWTAGPAVALGECDLESPGNWGDPDLPGGICRDYWPIISVSGDLRVAGGAGQGILLVGGDLVIDGSFRFSGLILVRGNVLSGGSGSSISVTGAVVAIRAGSRTTPLSGISITYAKCMVSNALLNSGELIPFRSRAWKQLF